MERDGLMRGSPADEAYTELAGVIGEIAAKRTRQIEQEERMPEPYIRKNFRCVIVDSANQGVSLCTGIAVNVPARKRLIL